MYSFSGLTWCVPNHPILTRSKSMLNIVDTVPWILIILVYFIIAFLKRISAAVSNKDDFGHLSDICFDQIAVSCAVAINKLPKTDQVRFLFIIFVIFAFSVSMGYQTYLTNILTVPTYKQKYRTLEDIHRSNLKIYYFANAIISLCGSDPISEKYEICYNETCWKDIVFRGNSAICLPIFYKNRLDGYITRNKKPAIHCFKEVGTKVPLTIYMKKGFPLKYKINKIIRTVTETGLMMKWLRDIQIPERKLVSSKNEVLKFGNLKPIFIFLIVGNFIASCVLILEKIFHKHSTKEISCIEGQSVSK